MYKKNLWMLAAILTCGLGMTLTSCSTIEDNPVVNVDPAAEDDYVIEVGEGMTMPEDKFALVPATTDCDPAIVNALKGIDNVTDVKPFKFPGGYDEENDVVLAKTAYYFNYKQPIDHDNPTKGWFKQQCVLTVAGKERPTVLYTEGYALEEKANHLDSLGEPTLVSLLKANCLQVEYRYHGWSLPEGYTNEWNYLTAKQHSADLHAIVTAIKQSGIIAESSKWLSTGVSKCGMTTAHYAYYYPGEMDAYVPFCAPFLTDLNDKGPFGYIVTKDAFDGDTERLEKVKTAFRAYAGDRKLQAECVKLYKQQEPSVAELSDDEVRMELLTNMIGNYFPKMSYVLFEMWEPMIPKAGDKAQKFLDFILADDKTKYGLETQKEYLRRLYYVNDLEPLSRKNAWSFGLARRGASPIVRDDPYVVQTCIELGNYCYDLSWITDLLTDDERGELETNGSNPEEYGVTYDGGKFIREFFEGMKTSTCNIKFVYGNQDPWTGGQIPDQYLGPNSSKLFIVHGRHNDAIDTWSDSEQDNLFQWLRGLGFDL